MKFGIFIVACVFIVACATTPLPPVSINPSGLMEEELATIKIHKYVQVSKIDGNNIEWGMKSGTFMEKVLKIEPGTHTFELRYADGNSFTLMPTTVIALMEKGSEYSLTPIITGSKVKFEIIDLNTKKSVILDLSKISGSDEGSIPAFIKYVLNPTMDSIENTVILENDQYKITFLPDMIFRMLNKIDGVEIVGRKGFETDFTMMSGKLFLLIMDPDSMTRDQFLNESNYKDNSYYIMIPISCTSSEVVFKFVKPIQLKDNEIKFSITVVNK